MTFKTFKMNDIEKKWKPKYGEAYFAIENAVDVVRYIYIGDDIDESCILSGDYFPTRERAEQVAKKIRLLLQLEQLHDQLCPDYEPDWDGTAKFLVAFDHTDGEMQAFFDRSSGESTLVYFRDVVTAMEAADILNAELEKSK